MLVGVVAQSPAMLPYHVLGDKQKLIALENLCLLSFDWFLGSVVLLSFYILAAVCIDAVIRITLICKALR